MAYVSDAWQPGLSDTAAAIAAELPKVAARIEERQGQSAAFIVENGAAVLGGHTIVDDVPPSALTPMMGDTFAPFAAHDDPSEGGANWDASNPAEQGFAPGFGPDHGNS